MDPHAVPQSDADWMRRALELACRGQGSVEPNPMVGCVIVRDGQAIGEGWHQRFGGPHAEREALENAGGSEAAGGATWYVTLEPCCHTGKTPPCSRAVVAARPARVVVAMRDPNPRVNGGGLEEIAAAGIEVTVGVCEDEARRLAAPFVKLQQTGRPWVIAKWAMTLDGKIATSTGDSRWISSAESRRRVHQVRGRVDGIMVGTGTVLADDPSLTSRPPGPRVPVRIVVDRHGHLPLDSQLVRTARQVPLRVYISTAVPADRVQRLEEAGAEVVRCGAQNRGRMIEEVLTDCGARNMTNLLVEGGASLLGAMHDAHAIDEAMVFLAPKILGGQSAITPIAGIGLSTMSQARPWEVQSIERIEDDVLVVARRSVPPTP